MARSSIHRAAVASAQAPLFMRDLSALAIPIAAIMLLSFTPRPALAAPPATVATCDGITDAYPVLGAQCKNNYAKINHAPANAEERLETYRARAAVLIIFRKVLLCNGMFGAGKNAQEIFRRGEAGHVIALNNLGAAMLLAGDPPPPAAPVLENISINKQQCK